MRILMINKYAHVTGGADRHCLELTTALRSRGHEVWLLSTRHDLNVENEGRFVPLTVSSWSRHTMNRRSRLRAGTRALWNPDAFRAARDVLSTVRPHVVHAHKLYPQLSVSPLAAARLSDVPVVQTVHDYEFISASAFDHAGGRVDRSERGSGARALNTATFGVRRTAHRKLVNCWVAISNYVQSRLECSGISSEVIPNFATVERRQSTSASARFGIAFVGRLSEEKGIADALAVARRLPDVAMLIVGDGPMRDHVVAVAAAQPNVEYVGHLEPSEISRVLSRVRIALIPSVWQEPASLVALEAMATGTPVVCRAVGGLAEYVRNAHSGLVVDGDAAALASACERILSNESLAREFAVSGLNAASSLHSVGAYSERLESVYERVRAQRTSSAGVA
jgi:glycosyltransferase involved in cell wall biosynthesis